MNDTTNANDEPTVIKRSRRPRNISPERRENCALALSASRILDTVAKIRDLNDSELAEAISSTRQTINKKRSGEQALTIFDMESLSYVLRIPAYLFLRPYSETLVYLAAQEDSESENGGSDLGLRPSTCNIGLPGHDPEIVLDLRDPLPMSA
jgi:hypothetical protein